MMTVTDRSNVTVTVVAVVSVVVGISTASAAASASAAAAAASAAASATAAAWPISVLAFSLPLAMHLSRYGRLPSWNKSRTQCLVIFH